MGKHEYRISFKADGISFFTHKSGVCEEDAIKELVNDVERNGCPPFFENIKNVERIENIVCVQ